MQTPCSGGIAGDDLPGGLSTPEEYASFAEKLVARGYKAIKLHTWMPPVSFAPNPKMDVKACAAVREAVGPNFIVIYRLSMLDLVDGGSSFDEVVELAQAIDVRDATAFDARLLAHLESTYEVVLR